jgi:hypothetical protein
MARQRPLPKRPTRSRIQTSIKGDVHERIDLYRARYGMTEARFIEAAAVDKLDGIGDAKTIGRHLAQLNQQLEVMSELMNLFVQLWMEHTPPLPQADRAASRRQTKAAYQDFVQQVVRNLSGGSGFLRAYTKDHITPKLARGVAQSAPPSQQPQHAAGGAPGR